MEVDEVVEEVVTVGVAEEEAEVKEEVVEVGHTVDKPCHLSLT